MPEPLAPLPEGSEATAEADRRGSTRYLCNLDLSYCLNATVEGEQGAARVRNISVGGISLVVDRAIEPGTRLTLQLENSQRRYSRRVDVRVTYCIEHPSGEWILGCAFLHKLTTADLRALLDE